MRIVVIANKWWECEAMLTGMLNTNAFPASLSDGSVSSPWYDSLSSPRSQVTDAFRAESRATFSYKQGADTVFSVEVWCASDLLEKTDLSGSSSSEKAAHMRTKLFVEGKPLPDLVIAVGTAGTAFEEPNRTGSVAIGAQVFLHNAHPPNSPDDNPKSDWSDPRQEKLIAPSIDQLWFEQLAAFDSATALLHFLPLRRNASTSPIITVGYRDVAHGTLNVTDYNEYKSKGPTTVGAYANLMSPSFQFRSKRRMASFVLHQIQSPSSFSQALPTHSFILMSRSAFQLSPTLRISPRHTTPASLSGTCWQAS